MFKWKKLGRIFNPTDIKDKPWLHEYAQCTSTLEFDNFIRVYFSCRPEKDFNNNFISYTTFLDLDKKDLTRIINIANDPILELGKLGTFDEFGIYPTCIFKKDSKIYLYYAGWTRLVSTFANVEIGVAISKDGTTFKRLGDGPIMSRTLHEPYQVSGPKVRYFNNKFYMYYLSGERWFIANNRSETIYKIRVATSDNGIIWNRYEKPIIPEILDNECQAGPDVFYYNGKYHMYFSYRYGTDFRGNNRGYRIGYAYSDNPYDWIRDDKNVGIELSKEGWDSTDMHYPHIFTHNDKLYMLYNGNEFGRYGFGLAINKG